MTKMQKTKGLNGGKGLTVAIIQQAAYDAIGKNRAAMLSAWAYFGSPTYQNHLTWLELPTNWKPERVENPTNGDIEKIAKVLELRSQT